VCVCVCVSVCVPQLMRREKVEDTFWRKLLDEFDVNNDRQLDRDEVLSMIKMMLMHVMLGETAGASYDIDTGVVLPRCLTAPGANHVGCSQRGGACSQL